MSSFSLLLLSRWDRAIALAKGRGCGLDVVLLACAPDACSGSM
ncbi:MAG TPA: hypothetical protein VKY24_15845 [Reyranella sp.]|nr:hypothetical protein [Reyranella sp.]